MGGLWEIKYNTKYFTNAECKGVPSLSKRSKFCGFLHIFANFWGFLSVGTALAVCKKKFKNTQKKHQRKITNNKIPNLKSTNMFTTMLYYLFLWCIWTKQCPNIFYIYKYVQKAKLFSFYKISQLISIDFVEQPTMKQILSNQNANLKLKN